ncbi:MAG TPA: hypothetical protein VKT77_19500 [Chthonomonadaceae bacterium]|nr:hypothetical protein [Chthonomonadaceae bacterium]
MRKLILGLLAVGLLAIALSHAVVQAQEPRTAELAVSNQFEVNNRYVNVFATLFKDGREVRSIDLGAQLNIVWSGLQPGQYEVHFQARGYGTLIKQIVISSDVRNFVNVSTMTAHDEVWNGGPTLADLERRIAALEKAQK